MLSNTARMIATVAIWLSVAIMLAGGVFHTSWNGDTAILGEVVCVGIICLAAAASTFFVWRKGGIEELHQTGPRGFEPVIPPRERV